MIDDNGSTTHRWIGGQTESRITHPKDVAENDDIGTGDER